jgi:phosphatidylserine decarboxylase
MWANRDLFSAPADGVITSQSRLAPDEDVFDVKGADCTVNDLLCRKLDGPALVTAIFMTAADVHCNRTPTDVTMTRHAVPPLRTSNVPMIWAEHDLLDKGLIRPGTFGFMQSNKRVVNRCYCGSLKYEYWLVQIADSDVNCILPVKDEKTAYYNQNEVFGKIEWGSMCVLVLPLNPRLRLRPLHKVLTHVEAGVDPLVSIERRDR